MHVSRLRFLLIVFLSSGFANPVWADALATLRQADRTLNAGYIEDAATLYTRAYNEAKREGNARLVAEIVNGMCGVDLANGDLKKLNRQRYWANKRKALEEPAVRAPGTANLLANSGFEAGFTLPWGTGHYERLDPRFGTWWNSSNPQREPTHACMKLDRDVRRSGEASLRIANKTPAGHNLFTTTAQRIDGLEPHSVFRLKLSAKANDLSPGAVKFTVDPGWEVAPLGLPPNTYDWREFTAYFSNGFNALIDFRVIHQNVGTIWLDDISIERVRFDEIPDDPAGRALRARILFGRGDNEAALLILDRMIATNESVSRARFQRGQIHIADGSYEDAIVDLEPLAEKGNGEAQMYLGDALAGLGRLSDARDWYEKAYQALKLNQLKVAQIKGRLARIYIDVALIETDRKRRDDLYAFAERYLEDNRRVSAHIGDGASLLDVSKLRAARARDAGDLERALDAFREGFTAYRSRGRQLARLPARRRGLILRRYAPFLDDYLDTLYKVSRGSPTESQTHQLAREAFPVAQYRYLTEANLALAQMAARRSSGDDSLARLLRERQDLANLLGSTEQRLTDAIAKSDPREAELRSSLQKQVREIAADLENVEAELEQGHGDFGALANPAPLSIDQVQGFLEDGEALLFFDADAALTWFITKTDILWLRASLDRKALTRDVAALRCGLDRTAWKGKRGKRCSKLLRGLAKPERGKPLPFDLDRAHKLYQALFGKAEDLIRGKHLLVVPTGPLAELPPQVLVTKRPDTAVPTDAADYGKAHWLVRDHAITVLPSVSSLEALRRVAEPTQASRAFIGFGNPVLLGRKGEDQRASLLGNCQQTATILAAANRGLGDDADETVDDMSDVFVRGLGNVAALRLQPPLPETAVELCKVARTVGAPSSDVHLADKATETEIKRLSGGGKLASYRIVHFATHGFLAGETERVARTLAEPALVFTPPETANVADDGLLTASEVAELRLDANWVVLSACNTAAAGEKGNVEALSGLARAFFYAGTRALLVSHWYVDSHAAVKITTGTFVALKADPRLGRAEALQRAMLAAMTDPTRPKKWVPAQHPALWAPFVIVGEGGRGRN